MSYWEDDVYALDPSDGTERWRFAIENGATATLAVADGTVYIGAQNATVAAITGNRTPQSTSDSSDDPSEQTNDQSPGFGIGESMAAAGTMGYLLRRRLTATDSETG